MKICMLTTSYPRFKTDWCVPFIGNLAKELAKTDNEIHIVTSHGAKTKDFETMSGVKIHRFQYFFPKKAQTLTYQGGMLESYSHSLSAKVQAPFFILSFFFKALKVARDCDVIHAHWIVSGLVAVLIKKLLRKPVLLTVWGAGIRTMPKFISKFVLKNVDLVNSFQPELTDIVKSLGRKKGIVDIPSMIDYGKFNRNVDNKKFLEEFNLKGKSVISFIGRLEAMKDPITFVRAIPHVTNKVKNVRFLIVGGGHLMEAVKKEIEKLKMDDFVRLTGPRYDTHVVLKSSTIFATISPLENVYSTTIIESMQMETPCILSTAGYTPKVFKHKHYAYLVPCKNPKALADAIILLLKNKKLRKKLSSNGRKFIKEHGFAKEHIVKETCRVYKSLIKK